MRILLSLFLPRDEVSVPLIRHLVDKALAELDVDREDIGDIAVAVSEACANVVKHSGPSDDYEVRVDIEGDRCTIRVVDRGRGFDWRSLERLGDDLSAEQGRGIRLMRALVDEVKFTSRPEAGGTVVLLEKNLRYGAASPLAQLAQTRPP